MWPKDTLWRAASLSSFELSYIAQQAARSKPSDQFPLGPGSQLPSWLACPAAGHPGTAQPQHGGLGTLLPLITSMPCSDWPPKPAEEGVGTATPQPSTDGAMVCWRGQGRCHAGVTRPPQSLSSPDLETWASPRAQQSHPSLPSALPRGKTRM